MEEWSEISGGYFCERRHLYKNSVGTIVPSTTQVFDILGCVDFENVKPEVLAWKREYGIACHAAVEYLATGDLDWDSLDEMIIPAVCGIEMFLKKLDYQHEAAEGRRIGKLFGMEFGLTSDLRGTVMYQGKRRHAIIDLKSGVKYSPTWAWQLGGYTSVQEKVNSGGWMGIVCQFDKEGNTTPHYIDIPKAQREFQTLLAAAVLKLNAGLAKLG